MDWARRARVVGLGVFVLALHSIAGCGLNPTGGDKFVANVRFLVWGTLAVDGVQGYLTNDYIGEAVNITVTLYYATGASEHALVVVRDPPRVGPVRWKGGSSPAALRRPNLVIDSSWCFFAADSVMGRIENFGGRAYHVVVTVNGKNGVQDIAPSSGWGVPFSTVVRDSAGQLVVPQVLKIRWEDYGGIADSVVSPGFSHAWTACPL